MKIFPIPVLKNPDAEKCAAEIAACFQNKPARQEIFQRFTDAHPGLKNWEASAIASRAAYLAMSSERAIKIEAHMATNHGNCI